jgi:hypothetical protein
MQASAEGLDASEVTMPACLPCRLPSQRPRRGGTGQLGALPAQVQKAKDVG